MKGTNQFPTLLEAFFMDRLMRQRQASPHTIASYRDTFRLLMQHAQQQLRKAPSQLSMPDLDTPFLGAFSITLSKIGTIAPVAATCVWLPSIRSFATFLCMRRNITLWHSACSQYQVNVTCVDQSASSRRSKLKLCSPRRTSTPGADDAIELCCCWPCRPDCAQQN